MPLDLDTLALVGSVAPVANVVADDPAGGGAQYSVSRDGILVHRIGDSGPGTYPAVWLEAETRDVSTALAEPRTYVEARVAPDGRRLAMTELSGTNWDVWVYDLERGTRTRLTFGDGFEGPAVWSPDGTELIYSSDEDGSDDLFRKRSDGSGGAEQLTHHDFPIFVSDWSPDGRYVIALYGGPPNEADGWFGGADLGYLDLQGDEGLQPFLSTRFAESEPTFSPDGRWVSYMSNESGRAEIYVRPFPAGEGRWQISDEGGGYARWFPDGDQLFYRSEDGIMGVSYDGTGGTFRVAKPRLVADGDFLGGPGGLVADGTTFADYDVGPDGRFLLFPSEGPETESIRIARVVVNWFRELQRLAPRR